MIPDIPDAPAGEIVAILRASGARFALVHGSRAGGSPRPDSDVDVAGWWANDPPASFDVLLPPAVDLVVLNTAPLEFAGRIALHGQLLFDDDPPARVRWIAMTRKVYSDEVPRMRRSHDEFAEAARRPRGPTRLRRRGRHLDNRKPLKSMLRCHLSRVGQSRGQH